MSFLSGAKAIATFGFMLTKTTFTVFRFINSLHPIGLAFNIILLFGHKIPIVKDRIAELGRGFMAAGSQIASIGGLVAPAFAIITEGIKAIASGEDGSVASGIGLLQTGLGLVAEIVQNRLYAAWLAFKIEISTSLNFIWDMYKAFEGIFGYVEGIVGILAGNIFGDLANGVSMLGLDQLGGGGGNMAATVMSVGTSIVSSLVSGLIDMKSWFLEGIYGLEQAIYASAAIAAKFTTPSTDNRQVEMMQANSTLARGFRIKRDEAAKQELAANQEKYTRSLSEGKATDSRAFNTNALSNTNRYGQGLQDKAGNILANARQRNQSIDAAQDPEKIRISQVLLKRSEDAELARQKVKADEIQKIKLAAEKKIADEVKKHDELNKYRKERIIEYEYQMNLKTMNNIKARKIRDAALENLVPKAANKVQQASFDMNNITAAVGGYASMVRGTTGVSRVKEDTEKEQLETQRQIAENTAQIARQGGVN
jgi:hypothetical protein